MMAKPPFDRLDTTAKKKKLFRDFYHSLDVSSPAPTEKFIRANTATPLVTKRYITRY